MAHPIVSALTDCLTMSSLELAKITGKEHRNVMRDIRAMLLELHGEGGLLKFEQTHVDAQNGQTYPIFGLPKRESLILVSGYSVTIRAKIIDRWQELETNPAIPQSFAAALRLAADQQLKIEHQQLELEKAAIQIAEAAPAVNFTQHVAAAGDGQTIGAVAGVLRISSEQKLKDELKRLKFLRLDTGKPYKRHLDDGLFREIQKTADLPDGSKKAYTQTLITGKGVLRIQYELSKSPGFDL